MDVGQPIDHGLHGVKPGCFSQRLGPTHQRLPQALFTVDVLKPESSADATSPLVNVAFDSGCSGSCSVTTCSCTLADRYWSDSSVVGTPTDAWVVDPGSGEIVWDTKDTDYAVRAVRTGP